MKLGQGSYRRKFSMLFSQKLKRDSRIIVSVFVFAFITSALPVLSYNKKVEGLFCAITALIAATTTVA
jgi:hypothetical protein